MTQKEQKFDEAYVRQKARTLLRLGLSYNFIITELTDIYGKTSLLGVIISEENERLIKAGVATSLKMN